jgi:ribosomal protein L11 methyltransferase
MAYQRVTVVVAGSHADVLCDAFGEAGAISTEVADADEGTERERAFYAEPGVDAAPWERARVVALFPQDMNVVAATASALKAADAPAMEQPVFERLDDADWVALTQRQFAPIRVGERLWIVPSWHETPDPGAINVALDPGAAFGTGSHPTTRLCLAWLERNVERGQYVIDYGCGSGILGIAALRLGAARASGIDIDPLALETARYNSRVNGVALEVMDADHAPEGAAHITIANILANPLRMLAPVLASHTRPGGLLALSGILAPQAGEVIDAYAPWASMSVEARDGDWVLVTGRRTQQC